MFQNIIEVLILSVIQGISEFLPISSSAHLILVSSLYEFKSNSLIIDISLHLGSLFAIIYFFRNELLDIKNNKRILSLIILGSIPLFVVGYILHSTGIIYSLRNIKIIAWTTLVFGILLYIADKNRFDKKISTNLSFQTIFFVSIFQILSLIPGVSRAGITITAARILKFNRVDSSKIAFLLSIPALAGASFLGLKDAINQSLEMNYFKELKKCGDPMYKKKQYWEFVNIIEKPDELETLSSVLQIPKEDIVKKKGAWMVDVTKPPNYDTLTTDQAASLDDQLNIMIQMKYQFIRYNGIRMSDFESMSNNFNTNPFSNKVIIIDEAHNFVSRIVNKLKKNDSLSMVLYRFLMEADNVKIIMLTGTPIINYPNEIAVLYNILRGYIKTWKFPLTNESRQKVDESFLKKELGID